MNAVCRTTLASFVFIFCTQHKLLAQYSASKNEVGISLGTLIYQGDLSAGRYGYGRGMKPSLGLHYTRMLDNYFSVRGNLVLGRLTADESKQTKLDYKQYRNFYFSTPVTELSALLVWNPAGRSSFRKLNFYLMGGVGASFLNVKRNWSNIDTAYFGAKAQAITGLATDTIHRTPRLLPVLPVGAGLRYQLSPAWSLNAEFNYRFTPTDYLDGFSQSVNPKSKDKYYGLSIGISYRFGTDKYRCPKVN